MRDPDCAALWRLSLFADLSSAELGALADGGFVQVEPSDAVLFEQGETPRFLHVILSGRVALFGTTACGLVQGVNAAPKREAIVEIFGAGDVVIAPAVLLDLPYLMSARVVEPSRIAFLPASAVRALLHGSASFAREAALMLARHWRLLARQLKDQKLRSTTQRLGSYLLGLAKEANSGAAEVELPFDRRTLASWLGTSPENLSRSIVQLAGLDVRFNGRKAHIGSLARLSAYCLEDGLR